MAPGLRFKKLQQLLKIGFVRLPRALSNRQFLMVAAVAVGLWAGLVAVLLKGLVHYLHGILSAYSIQYSWIYVISPAVGIFISLLIVRFVLGGELVRGTHHVLLAIARKSSVLPRKETYGHALTSAFTVGFGGSVGLESPIVQTGAAIGSNFASVFPVSFRDRTLLLACGAAAGIAAAFNAPVAGVLFALEVLLMDISISTFIPLLIAGAVGALCSKVLLNEGVILSFPNVQRFDYHNVPYYVLLGGACGLLAAYYLSVFRVVEKWFRYNLPSAAARFLVGCTILGLLILLFPAFLGEGYQAIKLLESRQPGALFEGSILNIGPDDTYLLPWLILFLALIKVFAVSFTIEAGGYGGNFAPSLFTGACLGYAFAALLSRTGLVMLPPANFCLVAMAGMLTGIFRSPLTAIFLIAEITGGYELMIPLMIVAAVSTAVARYLKPYSLDQEKLREHAKGMSFSKESVVLSGLSWQSLLERDFIPVPPEASLRKLVEIIAASRRNVFPVVDTDGKLRGIIYLDDIREVMFDTSLYDELTVEQLMQKPVVVAGVHENMQDIFEKFDKTGVWNMPVTDDGKYVGFLSKAGIFTTYRNRLLTD
ncbi:MAG: transporter [Cyclobacteriaceae bacterium]|nr:MAG: transporter [Cyclobacteriaceae bacterium]